MGRGCLPLFFLLLLPTLTGDEEQRRTDADVLVTRALETTGEKQQNTVETLAEFGFVAMNILRQRIEKQDENARKLLKKLVSVWCGWLDSADGEKRDRAEAYLYEAGDDAVEELRSTFEKGTVHSRLAAKRLLLMIKFRISPELYRRVGEVFEDYEERGVRERVSAVLRLEQLGGRKALEALKRIVVKEKDGMVRVVAANALVRIADISVLKFIKEHGLSEKISAPPDRYILILSQGMKLRQMENYKGALDEFQKILKEFPDDYRANYEVAMCYLFLKEYHSSIKHFKICLKERDNDRLVHYNIACAYALAGHKEKAFHHLWKAVENGYDDVEHMKNDEDLSSLRDDERFKELLERMKSDGGEE